METDDLLTMETDGNVYQHKPPRAPIGNAHAVAIGRDIRHQVMPIG